MTVATSELGDPPEAATLAVLAGGRGSRMGGTKDRLTVGGKPILHHLLDQANHDGPTLLVTSPAHPRPVGWERFDEIAFDGEVGQGPLAGLLAGLSSVAAVGATPAACFLSVDMPNVSAEQLGWLRRALADRPAAAGLLCRRPTKRPTDARDVPPGVSDRADGDIVEPFPCVFRTALALPLIADHWVAGRRSLRSLLDLPTVEAVRAPIGWPAAKWLNLNFPHDLSQAGVKMG